MTDTQNSAELLPCPFCGTHATIRHGANVFWVECVEEACGAETDCGYSVEAAANIWNRRPAAQTVKTEEQEQDDFEGKYPIPASTMRFKGGYAATEFNAWGAHEFCTMWKGWKARAALDTAAQAVKLPDVDQLSNIIRQVDGNHSLGAGALAEKIIEAVAGLNDYGRHGDEDMMVEE